MKKQLIQTILKHLQLKIDLYKRLSIIILVIVFFLGNYQICNYFYPLNDAESIRAWWLLKVDIYALIIALLFILAAQKKTDNIKLKSIEKLILNIGIGFASSNFIDRRILNTREYTLADLSMVIVVFLVSYYDFKKLNKLAKTHSGK